MAELTEPNFFCALPFHHVMVETNGDYSICCQHHAPEHARMNINVHSADEWRGSRYVREVQESMLKNQAHPGCDRCWKKEAQGLSSLRMRTEHEYAVLGIDTARKQLNNCEIDIDNICNLKCIMCNENFSSAILSENQKLKINKIQQTDLSWTDCGYLNLENLINDANLKVLNLRGGEPLVNKKLMRLLQALPQEKCSRMLLHITTNGTVYTQSWQEIFKKFAKVRMMFSVDAIGPLAEYIRFPGNWQEIENNIKSWACLPNVNASVHCVVQNLNVANLEDVIVWCQDHDLFLHLDELWYPKYLHFCNLPDNQKKQAIKNLQILLSRVDDIAPRIRSFVENCVSILQQSDSDPKLWKEFTDSIALRDRIRGNSWKKFIVDI